MSFFPAEDPKADDAPSCDAIDLVIVPRTADLGDFSVRRALPSSRRRMVGPFIFLDHMGPTEFKAGHGVDVRPHPHIGLSTVTYLFRGEIVHKRQSRQRRRDPSRRRELDDGGERHRPFRAHRRRSSRRRRAAAWVAVLGRPSANQRGNVARLRSLRKQKSSRREGRGQDRARRRRKTVRAVRRR